MRACPSTAARRLAGTASAVLLAIFALPPSATGQEPPPTPQEVAELDLEALGQIQVTSAARKAEPLMHATAAITVLTRDDIRRSGAVTLVEALRLVPGLDVGRYGGRDFVVSARGFTASANKLLLLVDGRTVYSPSFAGVFWDALVIPSDEIERIEVIRGPGGTLWGANAVNGVINILTRAAADTRGGRASAAAGTWTHARGNVRYGGHLGGGVAYRGYATAYDRGASRVAAGSTAGDDWRAGQAGFRLDAGESPATQWTLKGDAYLGGGGNRLLVPTVDAPFTQLRTDDLDLSGGNLHGRWTRRTAPGSELTVQAFYDRSRREQPLVFGTLTDDVLDAEVQYRWQPLRGHDLLSGIGYRLLTNRITGGPAISMDPSRRTTHLVTGFLQDEIRLRPDRLALTVGTKIEHNDYTGFELQPNVRLLWTPGLAHAVWGSVSRAVRTPSRLDADGVFTGLRAGSPLGLRVVGSEEFRSEVLVAYELGYRFQPSAVLSLELASFYNAYTHARTFTLESVAVALPRPVGDLAATNLARGHTSGFEFAGTWRATRELRIRATYAFLNERIEISPDAPANTFNETVRGSDPEHQASLWASFDLPAGIELDAIGRYVGETPYFDIPDYATADLRLGWQASPRLELSLVGQDLLQDRHLEFPTTGTFTYGADQRFIPRRGYAGAAWRF
jgi:iron complex outermembrane recepter protein